MKALVWLAQAAAFLIGGFLGAAAGLLSVAYLVGRNEPLLMGNAIWVCGGLTGFYFARLAGRLLKRALTRATAAPITSRAAIVHSVSSRTILAVAIASVLLGLAIGGTMLSWATNSDPNVSRTFHVAKIRHHTQAPGENSATVLSVYLEGQTGHVKDIVCRFPPDTVLTSQSFSNRVEGGTRRPGKSLIDAYGYEDETLVWSGIEKIEVLGAAQRGDDLGQGYYCQPDPLSFGFL